MSLIGAVRRRAAALYGVLLLLTIGGIYAAARLPASIFPSVTFPIVKVIADAGEEPAARMMPTVTRPLEEAILRVPGVRLVRSITSRGSSEISAEFAWGTDMQVALQRVQAETQRIQPDLPGETRIDVEWMNTAIFPIQGYALTSSSRSQAELLALAEFTLKPALVRIPGVSEVQIQGGRRREFQVWLDPRQLAARRLAAADVVDVVRRSHAVLSAGLAEQNHELYLTLVDGRVQDLAGLDRIGIPVAVGAPATLADLGEVIVADEVSYIRTTADGQPAVLLNLIRQPSANTVAIADGVQRLFREQPHLLPPDVRWTTFYDQARFVTDSVHGTRDAILIGVVLAALVLLVFLRTFRLTLVAVAAIPLTVAIVGLALGITGQTINLMTLAGVAAAIGLIADDAIVVVENIERHRAEARAGDPVERGVTDLLPAIVGSSLSTTVILLPFALLAGVVGAFFKPLALTMALALGVSFLVAALVVPVTIGWLGLGKERPAGPVASPERPSRFLRGYERVVTACVHHGGLTAAALGGCIVVMVLLYRGVGTDFLPQMDEGAIILDYWTPPGTSLTDTDAMLNEAEKIIRALPDVTSYSRRTGTQLGFFITEPNRGDYVITLKPRGERRDIETVMDDLRVRIQAAEPAIRTDFGQLLEDNIGDLTGGVPQPIDIKIFGTDPAQLQVKARQIAQILDSVPGIEDAFDGIVIAGPALDIRVNSVAAARYGLSTADIHAAVEPAVTGTVVDQISVGDRMYDLRVFTRHEGALSDLPVRAASVPAALIPLSAIATVGTGAPEAEIDRENLKTFIGVTARLSGRDLGGTVADIQRRIARNVRLAPDMSIQYGGQYQQQEDSFRALFYVLLGSLVLVSLVVLFEFGDWRAPVVTSACAIAVLAGVLLALMLTGQTLNISSYVGAIMMVGIVGENAIFVIHEGRLELGRGSDPVDAWARASRRRLRPVAMTILATAFALAPLAIALGHGSQLMQPLAIAVIGGFVLSGPVVLLVLPSLYRLLDPAGRLGQHAEFKL
ncbi:MAG TPA: efflux RND transporter permease subunit [Gemmatimonadales bacterium]